MKAVVLIIDGLGDLPNDALGGKTPLEAARTPVLDSLAASGKYGLVDPINPGETPSTYSGTGVLLGMVPGQADRTGRGPVEAAGLGIVLMPADIALRANFATVELTADGLQVHDRRAGRIRDGVTELASVLQGVDIGDGVRATLTPTHQHRAVLVLEGPGLHPGVSNTDPEESPLPAPLPDCVATTPAAALTAAKIDRFLRIAHARLDTHPVNRDRVAAGLPPANGIITRGAGSAVVVKNVVQDAGLPACVISGCNTVMGLGRLFGFDIVTDPRFTGDLDTDLDAKFAATIAQLEDHDLVFVHIKAPDICAHDRRPLAKRDFLEKIDAALAPLASQPVLIAVAADHTTDSNTGLHTDDPVPAIIHRHDDGHNGAPVKFGETSCHSGSMPRQISHALLLEIIGALR